MKNLTIILIRIAIICLISLIGSGRVLACEIAKGPSPLLLAYQKNIEKKLKDVQTLATAANACNNQQGSFSNEKRTIEYLGSIGTQSLYSQNLIVDFKYNIILVSEGVSQLPVINQGKILEQMEPKRIIPVVKSVVAKCALDSIDPATGQTLRNTLKGMIEQNRDILSFYKSVATGNKVIPTGLSPYYDALYKEILAKYNPESTATCAPDQGSKQVSESVGKLKETITKIMERIQGSAKKTNTTQDDWDKALELFSGGGGDTKKYADLQNRLLATELARQGLSHKARDAMLKKLSCVQRRTNPSSDPAELGKANYECNTFIDTISENFTIFKKELIKDSKTTTQYMERTLAYDTAKKKIGVDMEAVWSILGKAKSNDEDLNEKMITDLVNIHAQITVTNALLDKKAKQQMYKNCMKAQPSIRCPQPF